MKRYDLVMHMSPRELGSFIVDAAYGPCYESRSQRMKYSSCAGRYCTWLNKQISVHWCTNCKHYEKWGKCANKGCRNYNRIRDYSDCCEDWEPVDWWSEPEQNDG